MTILEGDRHQLLERNFLAPKNFSDALRLLARESSAIFWRSQHQRRQSNLLFQSEAIAKLSLRGFTQISTAGGKQRIFSSRQRENARNADPLRTLKSAIVPVHQLYSL